MGWHYRGGVDNDYFADNNMYYLWDGQGATEVSLMYHCIFKALSVCLCVNVVTGEDAER